MANNGTLELQEDRRAAVEAGLVHYQMVAAERDKLAKELADAKSEIAGLKISLEVQTAQMNVMESRVNAMQLTRDQAVAERAKYETLFASFQAMLRTFAVPAVPYITGNHDEQDNPDSTTMRDDYDSDKQPSPRQMPNVQRSQERVQRGLPDVEA